MINLLSRVQAWTDEKLVIDSFKPVEDPNAFREKIYKGDFTPILELENRIETSLFVHWWN